MSITRTTTRTRTRRKRTGYGITSWSTEWKCRRFYGPACMTISPVLRVPWRRSAWLLVAHKSVFPGRTNEVCKLAEHGTRVGCCGVKYEWMNLLLPYRELWRCANQSYSSNI